MRWRAKPAASMPASWLTWSRAGRWTPASRFASAVKQGNRLVLHAGAGVVYDSVPQREYEETQNKLRALAAAVGVEL